MKIAYYMPFKPLGHPNPSGDLVIGTELFDYLHNREHDISLASTLRCRWIYFRPLQIFKLMRERSRLRMLVNFTRPDIWCTYHSYYKAPDLLGPFIKRQYNIPFVIFQGIYSTKRRRSLKTYPGFVLNRRTLLQADHIFTNKKRDLQNLKRLRPEEHLSYIAPGIHPDQFKYSGSARKRIRASLGVATEPLVMTAAMMRPGVKTRGILEVITACGDLRRRGHKFRLLIVGDGENREELEKTGKKLLAENVTFAGKIDRSKLFEYYSSADIFAFPGIEESLGMVYLEAQSCRLPVVACQDWGGGEAVVNNQTGLLSPAADPHQFTAHLETMITQPEYRKQLGLHAEQNITQNHDILKNYQQVERVMQSLVDGWAKVTAT